MKNFLNSKFTSAQLSGFTQADGNFHISFYRVAKSALGVRATPQFSLTQHIKDKALLENLKTDLGVGRLHCHRSEVNYVVNSLPQIKKTILPIFEEYPVRAGKLESFLKFKEVINMMDNKEHLTKNGLAKIIEIGYNMNTASSRTEEKKQELLKYIGYEGNLTVEELTIPSLPDITPEFISGLTDGDGSFFIGFNSKGKVTASYTITQEASCKNLLEELVKFFNCGNVYDPKSSYCRYQVNSLNDINNKIIPHFKEYELLTSKKEHFETFSKVCDLLQNDVHKTEEGLLEIVNLAYNMNRDGKGRKLTKEEYIQLMLSKTKETIIPLIPSKDIYYPEVTEFSNVDDFNLEN